VRDRVGWLDCHEDSDVIDSDLSRRIRTILGRASWFLFGVSSAGYKGEVSRVSRYRSRIRGNIRRFKNRSPEISVGHDRVRSGREGAVSTHPVGGGPGEHAEAIDVRSGH